MKPGEFAQVWALNGGEHVYRVLFETIPDHVGYLVIESNHRTGLKDNEAIPSILFTPEDQAAARKRPQARERDVARDPPAHRPPSDD